MPGKIPAVAYYRMSTDRQETSIDDQRKAVEKYAKDNGYRILREYKDEGVSGWKSKQRKSFQRMIDDSDRRDFKAVLVWDQDRFSRFAVREFMHYWHILAENGVDIASVAQGRLDDKDFGWLTTGVTQHGKEQYCRDLAKNVVRGMREKRLAGQWLGQAPYGMKVVEKIGTKGEKQRFLAPGNADEVRIVRRIFSRRLAGLGTHLIARELNDEGFKTARGKEWKSQTIKGILERPAYVGDNMVGKFKGGGFERLVEKPELVKDTHEGIIDRETFDRVQALPKQTRGRGSAGEARLRGLLFCGRCGGPMYAMTVSGGSFMYRCSNYSEARSTGTRCVHCSVDVKQFEAAVFDRIREVVLRGDRNRLEAAIRKALKQRKLESQTESDTAAKIKGQLAQLDSQIGKAAERMLMIDEDLLPTAQAKLRELKERRDKLAEPVETVQQRPLPSPKQIADNLWKLDEIIRTDTPQAARQALSEIITGIVCDFEIDEARSTPKRKRVNFLGAELVLCDANVGKAEMHHLFLTCIFRLVAHCNGIPGGDRSEIRMGTD